MRRALLSWTLVFALLAAGFGASVLALNGDLYSAHGFVRSYLETLQRGAADEALKFDGVVGADPLVTEATVGGFDGIHLISDVGPGSAHTVRYAITIDGVESIAEFHVEHAGTRLGLFDSWRFAVSPIATLAASADHDNRVTINGVDAVAGSYAMLVPSALTLSHASAYLAGEPVRVALTEVGSTVEATVAVAPTTHFAPAAAAVVHEFLDTCAAQQVLQPAGCPFGTTVVNRLDGLPTWTISDYPEFDSLAATDTVGTWAAKGRAVAHISVRVKAILDGSTSTLEKDVDVTQTFRVTIGLDDSLTVSL